MNDELPIKSRWWLSCLLICCLAATGCRMAKCELDPNICQNTPPYTIERLPSPFPELSLVERSQDWGKELYVGKAFANQMDLYRAITCYKRALILAPYKLTERRQEIEYEIFFAYYLGNKFQEAIDTFETGLLCKISETFPARRDLLIMLYDAYMQVDQLDKACRTLDVISTFDESLNENLTLETAIRQADFPVIVSTPDDNPAKASVDEFLATFNTFSKSVEKAKFLNAILPGAGYYYVGQKKTAFTSFLINALFIGATYQLYERGYYPAAIILTSLEAGWYFGGINGAGLAANEYNRCLYEKLGGQVLCQNRLFPILMVQQGF